MVSLQNVLGHYCAETMELHKAYVRTICRICGIKASASAKCYKLSSIVDIVKLAYQGLDGSDVTLDSAETESDTVCQKCYRLLKNWNSDHNKYLLYKRKNPTKIREFVTSHKLPDTLENPVVHLAQGCPCLHLAGPAVDEDVPDPAEGVADQVQDGDTSTPSKLLKLNKDPIVSPSDRPSV